MSGKLRISGGILGGRYIASQSSVDLRPTTERVRESIFSSLYSRDLLQDAVVLDLFAGSGILGFEAISRGASAVTFVERDPKRARIIEQSVEQLELDSAVIVESVDVWIWLENCSAGGRYSLVFADPPYADAEPVRLLEKLLESDCLANRVMLVFEGPKSGDALGLDDVAALLAESSYSLVYANTKVFGESRVDYLLLDTENT